jgi:hypothetical protein
MSRSDDFTVEPVEPSVPHPHRKTRMKRRNAIVRRKRGRIDKSEDIRRHDFVSHSSQHWTVACENPSGAMTLTGFPNAADHEEQRKK